MDKLMNKVNVLCAVVQGGTLGYKRRPDLFVGDEKQGYIKGDLMDANAVSQLVSGAIQTTEDLNQLLMRDPEKNLEICSDTSNGTVSFKMSNLENTSGEIIQTVNPDYDDVSITVKDTSINDCTSKLSSNVLSFKDNSSPNTCTIRFTSDGKLTIEVMVEQNGVFKTCDYTFDVDGNIAIKKGDEPEVLIP